MSPFFVPERRLVYIFLVSVAMVALALAAELQTGMELKSQVLSLKSAKSTGDRTATITVDVTPEHPANTFVPARTLGACVDGMKQGAVAQVYTPANIHAMRSAGFGPLAYRLRTELAVETWHWNPAGNWSDPKRRQGYWTSASSSRAALRVSYGYRLPRRGSTVDQANNDGYSRLDDGDCRTFWKSNPYLDRRFTAEDNALHPQWIALDLGKRTPIDAIRIRWAVPYATRYHVDYWRDAEGAPAQSLDDTFGDGTWVQFPEGMQEQSHGGDIQMRLCPAPVSTRFVRIVMIASSETSPKEMTDVRDGLGYAIYEIYVGYIDDTGSFYDVIHHFRDNRRQTLVYVSSTDPWHSARNRDPNVEQPSFDRVFHSGLTNGLPLLTPTGLLYDTPDNAVAELRYLKRRGYPVTRVELGEEPDGQYISPEDYGALYIQWADALHRVDPALQLGGPGFQAQIDDLAWWPDQAGSRSWVSRFLNYLRRRGHERDLSFFSFEWYPFDDVCASTAPQLASAPGLLSAVLAQYRSDGLPSEVPWLVTEYGYSSFAGRAEVDRSGALLDADIVGQCLELGASAAYLYGYEPNILIREAPCDSWGNLTLFLSDRRRRLRCPVAACSAARLLTGVWAQPSDQPVEMYPARSDALNADHLPLVTAYALRRPDGRWAILLINKDPQHSWSAHIRFRDTTNGRLSTLQGPADLYQLGPEQYVWHPNGPHGYAAPDLPPVHRMLRERSDPILSLPPYSLSVVMGHGSDE